MQDRRQGYDGNVPGAGTQRWTSQSDLKSRKATALELGFEGIAEVGGKNSPLSTTCAGCLTAMYFLPSE